VAVTRLPAKFGQARILTFGGRCAIDRPVDGAVLGQDHELGALFGAGQGALAADGLFQIFGESARGVEDGSDSQLDGRKPPQSCARKRNVFARDQRARLIVT
jgi:hypothetical protein